MSIDPTIARVLHYTPSYLDTEIRRDGWPFAAIIADVNRDGTINLAVFARNGMIYPRTNVHLLQDGQFPVAPENAYAMWMPYQVGQAARTDELIKALTARIEALEVAEKARVDAFNDVWTGKGISVTQNTNTPTNLVGDNEEKPV